MVSNRINSCQFFRKGECLHQRLMEKVYLFPQIIAPEELIKFGNLCLNCLEGEQSRRKSPRMPVSLLKGPTTPKLGV